MKKTKTIIGAMIIALLFLTSCGGGTKKEESTSVTVKPKTTAIKGDLSDYFEVVNKDYLIKKDESGIFTMITVEVKRNSKDFSFPTDNINPFGTNGGENYHIGFGIELYGDGGPEVIINATEGGMGGPYDAKDVTGLMKLKKDETGFIRWTVGKTEGLKTFQMTSAIEKSNGSSNSSISSSSGETVSESGSANWDKMLDDYDAYVTDYIKFYKKALNGDQSALAEYPNLMQKATDLSESMTKAQTDNKLSTKQINQLVKIQTKMTQAAVDAQKK